MNAESWILLAGVVVPILGATLAWLLYIERRLGRMMTREDHERLCREARNEANLKLDAILEKIEDAEDAAHKSRLEIQSLVTQLSLTVAVLADRAGVSR